MSLTNEDKARLIELMEISKASTLREFARWLLSRVTLEEATCKLHGMHRGEI